MQESIDMTSWINNLIGSELISSLQYELASHLVTGPDYDACAEEFKKHADEERNHMKILLECAVDRDIQVNQDLQSLIQNAVPEYSLMTENSSSYYVKFHFKAEEDAIKTYRQFYDLIKNDDVSLAREIREILDEEIEHRKDLKKLYSSIDNGKILIGDSEIYKYFSKLNKKLRGLNCEYNKVK